MHSQFEYLLGLTIDGLTADVQRHMPTSEYKTFFLWALSAHNPKRTEWLQVMGIAQLIEMTLQLLQQTVPDEMWSQLLERTVTMNTYQIFEIISDNLAIGLAREQGTDATYHSRQHILFQFNQELVDCLENAARDPAYTLASLQDFTVDISANEQSLAPEKHQVIFDLYLHYHPEAVISDTIWPSLVANIKTCTQLAASIQGQPGGDITRKGLAARYTNVSRLLKKQPMTLFERAHVGANTILVIPTLAYYIAVIAMLSGIDLTPVYPELQEALKIAALLVRLLNDIGTPLLSDEAARTLLISDLQVLQTMWPDVPLTELLIKQQRPENTRLIKDLVHGEFNVCLDEAAHIASIPVFAERLDELARLYTDAECRMYQLLTSIDQQLSASPVSTVIKRFVKFHQVLYSRSYTLAAGEYAI